MRCGWLFDETINMYMWLLQQRNNAWVAKDPQNRKPTYFYSSFFFEKVFEKKKMEKKSTTPTTTVRSSAGPERYIPDSVFF